MRGFGSDVVSAVGPTRVLLLDFFCSGSQLYLLLSPYLCFISFYSRFVCTRRWYIDRLGIFQTKHLCVLIHIRNKDRVGTVKHVIKKVSMVRKNHKP